MWASGHPRNDATSVCALVIALLAGTAAGFRGLEGDPVTVEKVAVSYAYPDSLNVMAAVQTTEGTGKATLRPIASESPAS